MLMQGDDRGGPAFAPSTSSPVAARTMTAKSGSANRVRVLMIPYRATPDVADWAEIPQPRNTTQTTPMFHGPNGRLDPIPDRIR